MGANRAFPRVIWRTLPGAVISVACFWALLAGVGRFAPVLWTLFDRHPWLPPLLAIVGSMAGPLRRFWIRHCHRKQCAPRH